MDTALLGLIYRLLHLVGMAFILGGAVSLAMAYGGRLERRPGTLWLAMTYERLYWPILSLQVLTGIGNAGVYGELLPGPSTAWGATFGLKLMAVGLFTFASLPRTLVVARLAAAPDLVLDRRGSTVLGRLYGATAVAFAMVVYLAARLAHG